MARFHVRNTFAMEDRSAFVLAGFVIEGAVNQGMSVRMQMPFKQDMMMTAPIDHITNVSRPDGEVVCLSIRCAAPEEATLWEAFKIKDQTIEVVQAG